MGPSGSRHVPFSYSKFRNSVSCIGLRLGHCRITALRVFYGAMSTPYARIISGLNVFRFPPEELREAWATARDKIQSTNDNFKYVKGMMSNIIYVLISPKWNPISIDERC